MPTIWIRAVEFQRSVELILREGLDSYGLSIVEAHALCILVENSPVTVSTIARGIGYPPTSFTPILDKLERCGYCQRQPDDKDRRAVQVRLTESGERVAQQILAQWRAREDECFQVANEFMGSIPTPALRL